MTNLNFAGPAQPYRLRNSDFGLVTGKDSDGFWTGVLLSVERDMRWDKHGEELSGNHEYDLMECVRSGGNEAGRFKSAINRLTSNLSD